MSPRPPARAVDVAEGAPSEPVGFVIAGAADAAARLAGDLRDLRREPVTGTTALEALSWLSRGIGLATALVACCRCCL